jgi:hypothetical protein
VDKKIIPKIKATVSWNGIKTIFSVRLRGRSMSPPRRSGQKTTSQKLWPDFSMYLIDTIKTEYPTPARRAKRLPVDRNEPSRAWP